MGITQGLKNILFDYLIIHVNYCRNTFYYTTETYSISQSQPYIFTAMRTKATYSIVPTKILEVDRKYVLQMLRELSIKFI